MEILLVEDEESDVMITKRALADAGMKCRLFAVKNGEDALKFLRRETQTSGEEHTKIDLILLDLNMVRMNGFEFLEERKNDAMLKSIPVVVLTSSGRGLDIDQAYRLGANAYVMKPFDVDGFMSAVIRVVDYWRRLCHYS